MLQAKKHPKDSKNQGYKKVYTDADKPHAIRTVEENFRSLVKRIHNDSITMKGNRVIFHDITAQVTNTPVMCMIKAIAEKYFRYVINFMLSHF